jgi:tRNA-Thr(GGU) m(6)t(6)A37 methyltransferase TsaA
MGLVKDYEFQTGKFTHHAVGEVLRDNTSTFLDIYPNYRKALVGLDEYSHVFVIWWLHKSDTPSIRKHLVSEAKPHIGRPLLGVFATHSPRRPNPFGLSLVAIESVDHQNGRIKIEGIDAYTNSPIIDIKPYISSQHKIKLIRQPKFMLSTDRYYDSPDVTEKRKHKYAKAATEENPFPYPDEIK